MFTWFVYNSLITAVLAGVVLIVCRLRRFSPPVEHALWLLVLVKMLTPTWVAWPCSPLNLCADVQLVPPAPRNPAVVSAVEPWASGGQAEWNGEGSLAPARRVGRANEVSPTRAPLPAGESGAEDSTVVRADRRAASPLWLWFRSHVQAVLFGVWAMGAIAVLSVHLIRAVGFGRLVSRGERPPARLRDELAELAGQLGMKAPATRVVAQLACPVVWCLGRPKLVLPASLVKEYQPSQARGILLHELAHLRRHDHWVIWLEMVATWLWWWNPVFWFVRRRIRQCAELACDAWVVWALPDHRRGYAESLIGMVETISQTAAAAPAWGALGESRRDVERRLTMIFQENVPRRVSWCGATMIGLLALAVLPGWSGAQPGGQEDAPGIAAPLTLTGVDDEADPTTSPADVNRASFGVEAALVAANETKQTAADPAGAGSESSEMPGGSPRRSKRRAGEPEPEAFKTIKVFRLKQRDPAEMLGFVTGLMQLAGRQDARRPPEIRVLTVLKRAQPSSGYSGYEDEEMGYGMEMMSGMGGMDEMMMSGMGESGMGMEMDEMMGGSFGRGPGDDGLRFAVDARTKALIVRGTKDAVQRVAGLVAALDSSSDDFPERVGELENVQLVTFRHRNIFEVLTVLNGLGVRVNINYIPRNAWRELQQQYKNKSGGTLIATGPELDLKEVAELIRSLDISDEGDSMEEAMEGYGGYGSGGYGGFSSPTRTRRKTVRGR